MNEKTELISRNKILIIFTIILLLIYVIHASLILRGTYMDGTVHCLQILDNLSKNHIGFAIDIGHNRFVINFIEQIPMNIAYFVLNIKSKYWLIFIFSLPLFLFPLLVIYYNYKLALRSKRFDIFVSLVFVYATLIITSQIFAIVEFHLSVLLHITLFHYLVAKINYTKTDIFIILFLASSLVGGCEYIVYSGILYFIVSFIYLKDETNIPNIITKVVIGICGLLSNLFVLIFTLSTSDEHSETLRFLNEGLDIFKQFWHLNILYSVITFVLLIYLFFRRKYLTIVSKSVIFTFFILALLYLHNNLSQSLSPVFEQHSRVWIFIILPVLICLFAFLDLKKIKMPDYMLTNIFTISLICLSFQALWQMNVSYWYDKNMQYVKNVLETSNTPLYVPDVNNKLSSYWDDNYRRYLTLFSYTGFSILYSDTYKIKTLLSYYDEDDQEQFNSYERQELRVVSDDTMCIPSGCISIKNKFWDATDCANALNEHNRIYGYETIEDNR